MNNARVVLTGAALVFASGLAIAQTAGDNNASPPNTNQDSSPQKTNKVNTQDKNTGNDLSANKAQGTSAGDSDAQKTGHIMSQNSQTGNNLYGGAAFDKLDTNKTGMLSRADAKSNPWLQKNFKKCDSDNDGSVSRDEYIACTPHKQ